MRLGPGRGEVLLPDNNGVAWLEMRRGSGRCRLGLAAFSEPELFSEIGVGEDAPLHEHLGEAEGPLLEVRRRVVCAAVT